MQKQGERKNKGQKRSKEKRVRKNLKQRRRPKLVSDFLRRGWIEEGDRRRPESRAALLSGWLTISTTYTSSTSYSASSAFFLSFLFFSFPIDFYSLLLRDRALSLSSYMHRLLFCLQGSAPSSTNQANMNYIHHLTAAAGMF